ncbi:lysophospholipid acyltransferase family protein [Sulfurovum sp.]|uniref:lysophospholipid acyltransferase family protein n=1 Tax=Sulfurovum sp. TaxID=1969726 RepID=UPI0025D30879|nr:lysophospholipid acyltransferase family protein [Sulfurovum sp.]
MKDLLRQAGQVVIPPVAYLLMRIVWYTTFKKFHFITSIGEEQHVCVCWHGELFMSPQAYRKIHKNHPASAIISSHFDGSLIAGTLNLLGIRPLRGSSRKGAQKVLLQAFKSIRRGEEVLITPDGPKGPRHHMSDGAIGLALKSKLPVFVMNFKAENYWQLKSWDRFVIPKPFTKVDFYIQSISLEGMEHKEARAYLLAQMLKNTIM